MFSGAEQLLFGLLAIGALAPLLLKLRRLQPWLGVFALLSLVLGGGAALAWHGQRTRKAGKEAEFATSIPREGRPGGYVSSDQCQACHPLEYSSWHQTYHRTMTQRAGSESVQANFDNVRLEWNGDPYLLQKRGDEFWAELPDPDWAYDPEKVARAKQGLPSKPPRVWKRIGLLTGSHHMQIFWVPSRFGNLQTIFPFAWLIADRRWAPVRDTFLRDPKLPHSSHVWNVNCLKCHTTGGQPQQDPATKLLDTRVGELGIACEACHGPAEEHVRANLRPWHRYDQHFKPYSDSTVVNPSLKNRELSSHVCGQCHGIKWIPHTENFSQNGFRFRPGDNLDDSTPIVRPSRLDLAPWLREPLKQNPRFLEEHYWSDGEVRVSGREFNGLVDSPCYERGDLSCLSCHSMHRSKPDDQLAPGKHGHEACLQCHTRFRDRIEQHTRHKAGSSGSECYNCHMPHTTYGLLKAIRSHRISSPSVKTTLETGRPNACNLCHLDQTLQWTAKHLSDWYGAPAVELSAEEQQISAAVLWSLRGDAGQRALVAWSMGWEPAQKTSGRDWLPPFLAQLLADPYSAVRYIVHRSLRRFSGFEDFSYDFVGPEQDRAGARSRAIENWRQSGADPADRSGTNVLINPDGSLMEAAIHRLLRQRDDRSMDLQE
jgi:predicted CXXCH cytochrome family protein